MHSPTAEAGHPNCANFYKECKEAVSGKLEK